MAAYQRPCSLASLAFTRGARRPSRSCLVAVWGNPEASWSHPKAPRRHQGGPKRAPRGPRKAYNRLHVRAYSLYHFGGPSWGPRGTFLGPSGGPHWGPGKAPRTFPEGPKNAPRGPQEDKRTPTSDKNYLHEGATYSAPLGALLEPCWAPLVDDMGCATACGPCRLGHRGCSPMGQQSV